MRGGRKRKRLWEGKKKRGRRRKEDIGAEERGRLRSSEVLTHWKGSEKGKRAERWEKVISVEEGGEKATLAGRSPSPLEET